RASHAPAAHAPALTSAELNGVIQKYCQVCHNDQLLTGNMSLQGFDVGNPMAKAPLAEKMIQKLRAGMMPPPGAPRPSADTLQELVGTLERTLDAAAAKDPNPGNRTFQRLNRSEYEASIRDLLGLEVSAADYLPLDTKSANFDNIADVQALSATLMDSYMRAATVVSRLAVGYQDASSAESQYMVSRWTSQWDRVDGAPLGTRGGTSVIHNFPADGEYRFRLSLHNETTGTIVGNGRNALYTTDEKPEQIEISVDGERVALVPVDRWMSAEDLQGVNVVTDPVFVRTGAHRVTAAFLQRWEGPHPDLITPNDWSIVSTAIAGEYGLITVPHLRDVVVMGPFKTTGISDTPVRRRIFTCRPLSPAEATPCAEQILSGLASKAWRRPVAPDEAQQLVKFYEQGAKTGGFEAGIRIGLQALLASPNFIFRVEEPAANARAGENYLLGDFDLASRLSFFLWGTPPDQELTALAQQHKLADPKVLTAQARRMLADSRSEAIATRFASQWLQLPDVDAVHPDVRFYPEFYTQLADDMKRETELFFYNLIREDRPFLEMFTARYTFLNDRLARHYGISGVSGDDFRKVSYPDAYPHSQRQGLLSQGSVLLLTSVAPRTSPVLRGKWVMIAILGTPPPPPPAGVPALDETAGNIGARVLTTRERMEMHRKAPVCNSCHRFMDPIGLALDNYDVVGKWRMRENGVAPLDTRGQLYDGTQMSTPADLNNALLRLKTPIMRNFTKNMLAYATGRRAEYYDMPTVRKIVADAETNQLKMSSFVLGVINSDAFRMQRASEIVTASSNANAPR
ncbi:MAG: DUF1592 domain-containing protein, partial [Gemmatimonadetes bacterium]|nr:DUF1592 domain-containing protein [Gemmatimonadota bacterium]